MNDRIIDYFRDNPTSNGGKEPSITLAFAQSLDGSIALKDGQATAISGPESLKLTHQMRAAHQSILIGVGTVLADDPQLSVREVQGKDPQPIILDSHLRFPINAKLLKNESKPWIFCLDAHDKAKREKLEAQGAKVFVVDPNQAGRIHLESFIEQLRRLGIQSVMLEGGAALIASFLAAKLVNSAMITIAPNFIGGLKVLENPLMNNGGQIFPRILSPKIQLLGEDLILWGSLG